MPRNKEANQKIKDDRREQILSATLVLFATKGLAATRITDIATKTGMSQGLIYHYYQSKEEIFIWLISNAMDKMNQAAISLEKLPISSKEKITMATEGLLRGFEENENTANYYFLITQTVLSDAFPAEAKEIIRTKNDVKYEVIARIFKQGQLEETIKDHDVNEMTTLFFSSINGLALNKAIFGPKFKMPDSRLLLSMFLKDF
jgi:AcrR family transcriptional regulator